MPTVLLVDDSEAIRALLKRYVTSRGWEVIEADSAERALRLVRVGVVDACVTDLHLPGMDGIAFREALGREPRTARVPVLLVTGDADQHRLRAQAAGVRAVLPKPVERGALLAALDAALGGAS